MPLPLNMLMNKAERAGLAVGWRRSSVGNKEMIVTTSPGPCTVVSLSQCLCEYLSLSLSHSLNTSVVRGATHSGPGPS